MLRDEREKEWKQWNEEKEQLTKQIYVLNEKVQCLERPVHPKRLQDEGDFDLDAIEIRSQKQNSKLNENEGSKQSSSFDGFCSNCGKMLSEKRDFSFVERRDRFCDKKAKEDNEILKETISKLKTECDSREKQLQKVIVEMRQEQQRIQESAQTWCFGKVSSVYNRMGKRTSRV